MTDCFLEQITDDSTGCGQKQTISQSKVLNPCTETCTSKHLSTVWPIYQPIIDLFELISTSLGRCWLIRQNNVKGSNLESVPTCSCVRSPTIVVSLGKNHKLPWKANQWMYVGMDNAPDEQGALYTYVCSVWMGCVVSCNINKSMFIYPLLQFFSPTLTPFLATLGQ